MNQPVRHRIGWCKWKQLKGLGIGRVDAYRLPNFEIWSGHAMHDRF
ncbi:hypothetical protein [Burkholderia contaminans]|nr:hypothetical protein [Burkholderia contaminans]